jgi:peptidyl-prolyl cis-trans isomerase B (cyclophilin B)
MRINFLIQIHYKSYFCLDKSKYVLWEIIKAKQLHLKLLAAATILVFCFTSTALAFAQNDDKIVVLHTEFGHLAIELFPDDAPNTVENFLKLAESDFYDKTIFHRIINGFMIQGGDPNSKESDQSKWGRGGTGDNLKAEFNSIKHDRGIVSMARSAHPDSASSQFFIVHDRHIATLDEKYTVFGRIITQESYDTLDKIADLETTTNDIPLEVEKAEIKKTEVVTRSSLENILTLDAPERGESVIMEDVIAPEYIDGLTGISGDGMYRNTEYGFSFTTQEGWMLQRGTGANDPVLLALGVEKDGITPSITFEAFEINDKTFEEFFAPILEGYRELDYGVGGGILSEEHYTGVNRIAGKHGIVLVATQTYYQLPDTPDNVVQYATIKFKQAILEAVHFHFRITYVNHENNFDEGLVDFDNMISSFRTFIPDSQKFINPENEVIVLDESFNETEKGGCLIATATFGTEMAPQVQFLREIRDNIVLQTESGTSFMTAFNQFYYSFSPTIADYERENPIFKESVKLAITPLLASLTLLQFADIDSESEMLGYGIGVILLNVGMYFVIPAVFIMKIRKLQ